MIPASISTPPLSWRCTTKRSCRRPAARSRRDIRRAARATSCSPSRPSSTARSSVLCTMSGPDAFSTTRPPSSAAARPAAAGPRASRCSTRGMPQQSDRRRVSSSETSVHRRQRPPRGSRRPPSGGHRSARKLPPRRTPPLSVAGEPRQSARRALRIGEPRGPGFRAPARGTEGHEQRRQVRATRRGRNRGVDLVGTAPPGPARRSR